MCTLIYTIEDDHSIRTLITCALESATYQVRGFSAFSEMEASLNGEIPDLFLVDLMLPEKDGIQTIQWLRDQPKTKSVPIMIISAKGDELDKVKGLDSGASDYMEKPFGMLEFLARVRVLLRQGQETKQQAEGEKASSFEGIGDGAQALKVKELVLNHEQHQVFFCEEEVQLTLKEYNLLKYLMEHPGIAVERETLLKCVWGYDYIGESRTLDMHIKQIRQKCNQISDFDGYIKTVRGVGYKLV